MEPFVRVIAEFVNVVSPVGLFDAKLNPYVPLQPLLKVIAPIVEAPVNVAPDKLLNIKLCADVVPLFVKLFPPNARVKLSVCVLSARLVTERFFVVVSVDVPE